MLPKHASLVWSQNTLVILIFLLGMLTLFGFVVGYAYFNEFAPEDWQLIQGTLYLLVDGGSMVPYTIYFWKISQDWRFIVMWAICMHLVAAAVGIVFTPESPKWLYVNQRW